VDAEVCRAVAGRVADRAPDRPLVRALRQLRQRHLGPLRPRPALRPVRVLAGDDPAFTGSPVRLVSGRVARVVHGRGL